MGPDNGLLSPAVALVGGATRIVAIENPAFRIPSQGATFAGRDIFAPAAASLAAGEAGLSDLGPEVSDTHSLLLPLPETSDGEVSGEVWWVDAFGNCQTNITPDELELAGLRRGSIVEIRVGSQAYEVEWVDVYGQVEPRQALLHVDSAGLVALGVRGGSAAEMFGLGDGTSIRLGAVGPTEPR